MRASMGCFHHFWAFFTAERLYESETGSSALFDIQVIESNVLRAFLLLGMVQLGWN